MIRLSHLSQILSQIGKNFLCPKCQKHYGIEHMHLMAHDKKNLQMQGSCPFCESKAQISVKIDQAKKHKKGTRLEKTDDNTFHQAVPLQDKSIEVDQLKRHIKGFDGKDIRDLF